MIRIAAFVVRELREALPVVCIFLAILLLGRATQALLLEGYRTAAASAS